MNIISMTKFLIVSNMEHIVEGIIWFPFSYEEWYLLTLKTT